MTMSDKKALKILDYWYMSEFLNQDDLTATVNLKQCASNVGHYLKDLKKKEESGKKSKVKDIEDVIELSKQSSIYAQLVCEGQRLEMKAWSDLTLFVGQVSRDYCVSQLAKSMELTQFCEPIEQRLESLVVFSLQVDNKGEYIPHSLSISPIIWAMVKLKKTNEITTEMLSSKKYDEDVKKLEESLNKTIKDLSVEKLKERTSKAQGEFVEMPPFAGSAVDYEMLDDLYHKIFADHFEHTQENERIYLRTCFYRDMETMAKNTDEKPIPLLSRSFYTNDLALVRKQMQNNDQTGMMKALKDYIVAPIKANSKHERVDLLHSKDHLVYEYELQKIFQVKNAPLAKWPSRFQPALMQQAAINLATGDASSFLNPSLKPIFSVNGPPGTGKTTLLKEIIADHIVKKAIRMADIETPNEAFEMVPWKHGELYDASFLKFQKGFYRIKDEYKDLIQYNIIVASSNNTAVENISKELPVASKIIKDLSDDHASKDQQHALKEVSDLFDERHTKQTLNVTIKDEKDQHYKKSNQSDIYFTHYAKQLYGGDAWGLIAVPLGKKANIKAFYKHVLGDLSINFNSNQSYDMHQERYEQARQAFLDQLKIVKKMQKDLNSYSKSALELTETKLSVRKQKKIVREKKEAYEKAKREAENNNQGLQTLLLKAKNEKEALQEQLRQERNSLDEKKKDLESLNNEILVLIDKIHEEDKGLMHKIFHKSKSKQVLDEYKHQLDFCQQKRNALEDRISSLNGNCKQLEEQFNETDHQYQNDYNQLTHQKSTLKHLENAYLEAKKKKETLNETVKSFKAINGQEAQDPLDRFVVIDDEFAKGNLSDENSTYTQVQNPWLTSRYDREREKLFYYALQLEREFVTASKYCISNLKVLCHYWSMEQNSVKFHPDDMEAMAPSLFHSLFLLVPVISTTFASVGSMFKDVTEPESLGTLIVDEAGQASPQFALGALMRSLHAIIVGDPLQIEPVVQDESQILKQVYSDPFYKPYKDVSLSVQKCADLINSYGTYLDQDKGEWLGCPLIVHRRCIDPMYTISNQICYKGIMRIQTAQPSLKTEKTFALKRSQWFNVPGVEKGQGDHFVKKQGKIAFDMVKRAFSLAEDPSLFIISPFKTVVEGMRNLLKDELASNDIPNFNEDWIYTHIGTVHTFQGKEANEVIFLLGCDQSVKARGAILWVNKNLVNVAVTRAKYHLAIIGDYGAWRENKYIKEAKHYLDVLPIEKIYTIQRSSLSQKEKQERINSIGKSLPTANSFVSSALGNVENVSIEVNDFAHQLSFLKNDLSDEEILKFGFTSQQQVEQFDQAYQTNLKVGIQLYYALKPFYGQNQDADASCCGILFCKCAERVMQENFIDALKKQLPYQKTSGDKHRYYDYVGRLETKDFTLGKFKIIIYDNARNLKQVCQHAGIPKDRRWWMDFGTRLYEFTQHRNSCCHPKDYSWRSLNEMIDEEFVKYENGEKIKGILFDSAIGKALEKAEPLADLIKTPDWLVALQRTRKDNKTKQ